MKTEMEKCLDGEHYDCHDEVFLALKSKADRLLRVYNALSYDQKEEKQWVLEEMLGSVGSDVSIAHAFVCDYGCNIHIGNNVSINTGCTFVDCNKISIGNNVLIAPNVQIYTATHPVELDERLVPTVSPSGVVSYTLHTYALPVTIEDGCWMGAGVIILPGVRIGRGSVVAAGSVVIHDVPVNSLVMGNPCRVVRKLKESPEND